MAFDLFNVDIDSFIEKVENDLGITKSKASPYPSNLHGVSSLIGQSSIIQMCAETAARNCATEGQIILKEGFRQNSKEDKKELRRATAIMNCPDGRNTGDKLHYLAEKDRQTVGAGFIKLFYNSKGKVESFHHIPSSWVTHIRTEINVPILVDSNNAKEDEKRAVIRDFDLYQITRVFNVVDSNANVGGDVDAGSIQTECIYECHCPYENPSDISNQKKEKLKKGKPYTRLMVFKNDIGDSKMGLPYWVGETGNLLALLAYDSLSHKMINNNLIPRLIIMLGGASFSKEQMEDMKEEFETQLSGGSASQNTPLFLNAAGQKATQVASPSEQPIIPEISIHEIKNAFNPDSVQKFFSYVEDRVLKSYRIPRLLIGDTTNYNRATADTALQAVESQVFAPFRKEWDTFINNVVLGNGFEGSQKITYKSKPMSIMPIEGILKMLTTLSNIGALTIKDVTNLAQQLVDIKLEEKSDEINKLLSAAVAKLQPTADGATASAVDKSKETKSEITKGPYQNTGE